MNMHEDIPNDLLEWVVQYDQKVKNVKIWLKQNNFKSWIKNIVKYITEKFTIHVKPYAGSGYILVGK